MSTNCGYLNKPTVDNSSEYCEDFENAKCIIFPDKFEYTGSREGKNLHEVIEDLIEIINTQSQTIIEMGKEITRLKYKIK